MNIVYMIRTLLERGFIFSFLSVAVYVASQIIRCDNLAIEGAFGLGGACAALLATYKMHPALSMLLVIASGIATGLIMGLLITRAHINNLIAGIAVTSGLFSISLKIAGSNLSIPSEYSLFSSDIAYSSFFISTFLSFVIIFSIKKLLTTETGFLLQAVGRSPQMLINIGQDPKKYTLLGIILSNSCAALCGALFVYYTGYFSIWTSVGMFMIGLIGSILAQLFSASFDYVLIIGSILYQVVVLATFELQLEQCWNKLITALFLIVLLIVKNFYKNGKNYAKN